MSALGVGFSGAGATTAGAFVAAGAETAGAGVDGLGAAAGSTCGLAAGALVCWVGSVGSDPHPIVISATNKPE